MRSALSPPPSQIRERKFASSNGLLTHCTRSLRHTLVPVSGLVSISPPSHGSVSGSPTEISLDLLAVHYGRQRLAGRRRIEAVQLEPVDQEKAAITAVLADRVPISGPRMSNASRGSPEAIIATSPCRFTSKNPTVIQTAY